MFQCSHLPGRRFDNFSLFYLWMDGCSESLDVFRFFSRKVSNYSMYECGTKMNISLSAFTPENLVSRNGFVSPAPRQPAHLHTQAKSGAYLRDPSRVPRRLPLFILNRHTPSGQSRVIGSRNCVPMAFTAKGPPAPGQ